ncbi:hypothetical protein H8959_010203, partial [Pygathrix nigripes]
MPFSTSQGKDRFTLAKIFGFNFEKSQLRRGCGTERPQGKCAEPLFSDDSNDNDQTKMTTAQFYCQYCTASLLGKKYVLKDDSPYCVTCYDHVFSNYCEECKKPIESNSKDLCYKDRHWHEGCFKCTKCNHSLVEKPFAAKDERLLCTECYSNECSSRCFHCKRTIMPGSRKMEFKGNCWHETCFVCENCRQPIGTKPLISKESGNYCVPCFEKEFAHYCNFCKKV